MTDDELLAFEQAHPGRDADKDGAIVRAGLNRTRYYQRLLRLTRERWVLEKYPDVATRTERLRTSNRP